MCDFSLSCAIKDNTPNVCRLCANTKEFIPDFNEKVLRAHKNVFKVLDNPDETNSRVGLYESIEITEPIVIKVPIVFHIMFNTTMTVQTMTNHLINKVIPAINADFAKNQLNFSNYSTLIRQIFSSYPNKMNIYLEQIKKLLPDANLIKWVFSFMSVNFVKNNTIGITGNDLTNNTIKAKSPAVNPDKYLNIWIAPSFSGILGISVFPWFNRLNDNQYNSAFNPTLMKNHGILIASSMLGPSFSAGNPYNLYKTFSHEIGHYFGMLHNFDNYTSNTAIINQIDANLDYNLSSPDDTTGDMIVDTPYSSDATVRLVSPINARTSLHMSNMFTNSNTYQPMFMDIMDYSYDSQLFFFTKDQHQKMIFMIKRYFPNILLN